VADLIEADLAAAFSEWDRRYREDPERFATEMLLGSVSTDTYGDLAAAYLLKIVDEQRQVGRG
jgi:hypothetical protein